MHSHKTFLSVLAIGLTLLTGLSLTNAYLRTSVVQFSMSIASSPEEPPSSPEEEEETESSTSHHSGGGGNSTSNNEEAVTQDPVDVNVEEPPEVEVRVPDEETPNAEMPNDDVSAATSVAPPTEEAGSTSSSSNGGGRQIDSESKTNLGFVQKPIEEELPTDFEQAFPEESQAADIEVEEYGKPLITHPFENNEESKQEDEVAILPVTPIQFIKKIFESLSRVVKKWWTLVEIFIVKHLF